MAKVWNNRWKSSRWDAREQWQGRESKKSSYGWLKRSLVAAMIFTTIYAVHLSDSSPGQAVTEGVRYILTTETDFNYLAEKVASYAPRGFDVAVLQKIKSSMLKPADPLMYMTKPVDGKVISPFGWRTDTITKQQVMHEGIDIEAPLGAAVKAAAAGTVRTVSDSGQYGKIIIIEHSQDIVSVYGYLGEVLVKPQDTVSQGQVIARVGKNDSGIAPLLYFEVREKGTAIDPLTRIKD